MKALMPGSWEGALAALLSGFSLEGKLTEKRFFNCSVQ
ncbi:rCG33347 [Rattus norvegicus]|uniref:RCG33347 n=1 Tax=Rattus norvegicus TaxID=10116 RepID=A6HLQ4_RAT|nr:rCG33347 [Rattus norvegicus]